MTQKEDNTLYFPRMTYKNNTETHPEHIRNRNASQCGSSCSKPSTPQSESVPCINITTVTSTAKFRWDTVPTPKCQCRYT